MINKQNKFIFFIIFIIIIVGGIGVLASDIGAKSDPQVDLFAQCITDSGAKFYGAFWCPHCQDQKEMFGQSKKLIPYVECSTSNMKGQLPVCKDAGIEAYPTWVFADESELSGLLSFETLSGKTQCPLPILESNLES